jgi:L-alanine-DL-glutamate epimerase-like enolase superfamily enzyme
MQLTRAIVTPVELKLRQSVRMAGLPEIRHVTALFVRLEMRDGRNAWGCGVAHLDLTGETADHALSACRQAAERVPSLHPTNLEYSLAELYPLVQDSPAAACAFDLAFYDLLGLIAGMPLYRLLGGYRNRIQTSATLPIAPLRESVEQARQRARLGFRILKIKGGLDPEEDVRRVKAIHTALPGFVLRLDADGGYDVQAALDVARALAGVIEMLEQPTPASDLNSLSEVTRNSPVPVLADQSASGPASALELAAKCAVNGLSIKMAVCGGLRCARQMDAIASAARLVTMVSCLIEPALLIAAGLSFALSSPNVRYVDLDGHLELEHDPTNVTGFKLEDGWLVATDVPGLGCTVAL